MAPCRQAQSIHAVPALPGKEKDEKADASAAEEQGLVNGASDD